MKVFSRKKKKEEWQWSDSSNYKRHEQLNKQPELLQKPEEPKTMETEREEPVMPMTEEKKFRIADRKKCNMSGTAVMKSWKVLHG